MTSTTSFLERFAELVRERGWGRSPSPAGAVEDWRSFVQSCEDGYHLSIYEFDNDRSIRTLLEGALTDPVLRARPQARELREAVEEIDDRFRAACRDDAFTGSEGDPWWTRLVPRLALDELEADLRSTYGIVTTPEPG